MKQLITILTVSLLLAGVHAQGQESDIYYEQAFHELTAMLEGGKEPSFKRAVFVTENAYLNNQLDYQEYLEQIDLLAHFSKRLSADGNLDYSEKDIEDVRKKFAVYQVMKDTIPFVVKTVGDTSYGFTTQPFVYDFEDFFGENDWKKMFVTKLLSMHSGNCHSLPFLYKIIAEEIGTEAHLAMAPNHTYIKQWTDKTGWFNTELTSGQFPIDAWIMASGYIKLEAIQNRLYMDTLSQIQSIAVTLTDLAQGYQKKHGETHNEEFVLRCLDKALAHYPNYINALVLKAEVSKSEYKGLMDRRYVDSPSELWDDPNARQQFEDLEKQYAKIVKLGYRKQPKEMYLNWLMDIDEKDVDKGLERYTFEPPQPFKEYGHEVQVTTLSKGKYQEFFDQDTVIQIGTVMFNWISKTITHFIEYDTIYSEATLEPEVISRWIQQDPLAEEFYNWSPYNFVYNNPIRFSDPTGLAPEDDIYLNESSKEIYRVENDQPDRTFVIKTTKSTSQVYTQNEIQAGIAGTSNPISKQAAKNTEAQISAGNVSGDHMQNVVQIENQGNRQGMSDIAKQDNGKGGTGDANNREYGGTINYNGTLSESPPGAVANPAEQSVASITHTITGQTKSTFHSHPSGTVVDRPGANTVGGTTTTSSFMQGPSSHDIATSGSNSNYVFGRSSGTVYIYNDTGVIATMPMKRFVNPKK